MHRVGEKGDIKTIKREKEKNGMKETKEKNKEK